MSRYKHHGTYEGYPLTVLQIIEKNTRVRLKIVGTRVDATEIVRTKLPLHIFCPYPSTSSVCHWDHQGGPSGSHRLDYRDIIIALPQY
jgi:hypothetical protein